MTDAVAGGCVALAAQFAASTGEDEPQHWQQTSLPVPHTPQSTSLRQTLEHTGTQMLALGARGVLLGRAWSYALAARGEAGVTQMLGLIAAEMRVAMALTGCTRIDQIDRSILAE